MGGGFWNNLKKMCKVSLEFPEGLGGGGGVLEKISPTGRCGYFLELYNENVISFNS